MIVNEWHDDREPEQHAAKAISDGERHAWDNRAPGAMRVWLPTA